MGTGLETGTGFGGFYSLLFRFPLPVTGKAPQHLLSALPAPYQIILPHHVQGADDGVAFDLDVLSHCLGRDYVEVKCSAGSPAGSFSV